MVIEYSYVLLSIFVFCMIQRCHTSADYCAAVLITNNNFLNVATLFVHGQQMIWHLQELL